MTARLKPHPAAQLFPMLSDAEIDELAADIKARGQLHKGVVHEGKILDGRHREEACHRAGVPFDFEQWSDVVARAADPVRAAMSPVEWVLSTNLRRRHLNETQRAVIAEEALPLLEAEARARQKAGKKVESAEMHNWAKVDAGKAAAAQGLEVYKCTHCGAEHSHHQGWKWTAPAKGCPGPIQAPTLAPRGAKVPEAARPGSKPTKGKASELAAKAVGASARSVERAKAVLKKKPELREQLKAAKMTLKQAEKAIKKEEQLKNVLEYRPPVGKFAVIVADPSWKFDDELDGSDQARGGVGYPPQTEEEICAMQVGRNFAAPDCALWLWVTGTHLMNGACARVLDAWGFTAKCPYTWRKVDKAGNDRMGTGRYGRNVTEFLILAIRGKPVVDAADQPNIFDAPRSSRHSQKPDRAYEIIEKVTPCAPEARLELHAIEERKGWVTSGSEQQAAARAQRPDARDEIDDVSDLDGDELIHAMHSNGPGIQWVTKKHPKIVAVGLGQGGRRYEVLRESKGFSWRGGRRKPDHVGAVIGTDAYDTEAIAKAKAEHFEAEQPGAAAPLDDGTLCGIRPSKNGDHCILRQGHDGLHSNGKTTWREKKRKLVIKDVPAEA